MNKIILQVDVDEEIKNMSDKILFELGFSLSDAINIFLKQVALQGKLPFDIKLDGNHSGIELEQDRNNFFAIENMDEIEDAIMEDFDNILDIDKRATEFDKAIINLDEQWFDFKKKG